MKNPHQHAVLTAFAALSVLTGCGGSPPPIESASVATPEPEGETTQEFAAFIYEEHDGVLEEGDDRQSDGTFQDSYVFTANVGTTLEITMASSQFAPHLALVDAAGSTLGENASVEGESDARIQLRAPASGEYTVIASSIEPAATVGYGLVIRATPASTNAPPTVRVTDLGVRGSFEQSELLEFIEAQLVGDLMECFRASGIDAVAMRVIISPTGSVQNAHVDSEENAEVNSGSACVVGAIRRWPFYAPEGGGIGILTFKLEVVQPV